MSETVMASGSAAGPGPEDVETLDARLEAHRVELTGYCYRMLGSAFEAEDAVQETFIRAWRGFERFESRSKIRSWLYRIATNVCLDMRGASQRRALPIDLSPAQTADQALGRLATPPTLPWHASQYAWPSSQRSSTCRPASVPC